MSKLNAFALCEPGLEDISASEVQELIGAKCKIKPNTILFPIKNSEQLALLCYRAQSLRRIALLCAEFRFKTLEDIKEKAGIDFPIQKNSTIRVECERVGEHAFRSVDVEQLVSGILNKKYGTTTDFDNPDTRLFISIRQDNAYIGVDFSGFDLAMREYKVFTHAASLKGTIAYAAVRLSGFTPEKRLGVCLGKSGMIPIEAALYLSKKSVNFYRKDKFAFWKFAEFKDKDPQTFFADAEATKLHIHELNYDFRGLNEARKNAKIAGVEKLISFAHTPIDWLDVKFKEGELDILFAQPVAGEVKKMREFFHQAEYVAHTVVTISAKEDFSALAKEFHFTLKHERKLVRGNGFVLVQVFVR